MSVAAPDGKVFLRASLRRTDKCSDGMSDDRYPYEFSGSGTPGTLRGCCRLKPER